MYIQLGYVPQTAAIAALPLLTSSGQAFAENTQPPAATGITTPTRCALLDRPLEVN